MTTTSNSTESPTAEDLPDRWMANRYRPAWVRRHREALQDATGLEIPRHLPELEDWLSRYRSTVTRKLREQHDEEHSEGNGGDDA